MGKCWDYFNPPKPEEEIAFTLQKFPIFSKKQKKKQKNCTEIICVKHLTVNKYYWC